MDDPPILSPVRLRPRYFPPQVRGEGVSLLKIFTPRNGPLEFGGNEIEYSQGVKMMTEDILSQTRT